MIGDRIAVRRDPFVRRPRLSSSRSATARPPPTRRCARIARPRPALLGARRELHRPFDPRLHRRQLSDACSSACTRKPRRSRMTSSPSELTASAGAAALHIAPRPSAASRSGVLPLVEVCRRLEHSELFDMPTRRWSSCSATSPTMSAASRRRSTRLREMLAFCLRGEPAHQPVAADDDLAPARRLGGDPRRADRGRRHLRDELPPTCPSSQWENGYYLIVGLVVTTCVALYVNFRRRLALTKPFPSSPSP